MPLLQVRSLFFGDYMDEVAEDATGRAYDEVGKEGCRDEWGAAHMYVDCSAEVHKLSMS
jgi:hypothetical protein